MSRFVTRTYEDAGLEPAPAESRPSNKEPMFTAYCYSAGRYAEHVIVDETPTHWIDDRGVEYSKDGPARHRTDGPMVTPEDEGYSRALAGRQYMKMESALGVSAGDYHAALAGDASAMRERLDRLREATRLLEAAIEEAERGEVQQTQSSLDRLNGR